MTLAEMLADIRTRKAALPGAPAFGISVASAYLSAMAPCLDGAKNGELCPVKLFKLASAELWQKELAEAAERMTYCNDAMRDIQFYDSAEILGKSIDPVLESMSGHAAAGAIKGAVLVYDCVLSSKNKDRDGDIIEQRGGLEIDLKMPLLWQHIQVSPIGKHIALLDQDEFTTKSRFAIADTDLGRDAAVLVKFGALRKSHGFRPNEFAPLEIVKGHDGRDVVKGWHIKKAKCMEGSLVSIPANPDTAILSTYEKEFDGLATAFGKNLLQHPMVKHWAKSVYDARPAQAPGVELVAKNGSPMLTKATITVGGATVEIESKGQEIGDTEDPDPKKCSKCGKMHTPGAKCPAKSHDPLGATDSGGAKCPDCGKNTLDKTGTCSTCGRTGGKPKDVGELSTKAGELTYTKAYGNEYIDGSFEKIQSSLRRTARDYLSGKGVEVDRYSSYAELMATFADSAIVCLYSYSAAKSPCYRVSYVKDAEGFASWTGDPTEVEVKQTVVEKAAPDAGLLAKQLVALAAGSADPSVLKACEDVAGMASVLRSQHELREVDELLNI